MRGYERPDISLVLPNLIRRRADAEPSRPFLRDVGGVPVGYGEVFEASVKRASALKRLGIEAGDRVATMMSTSIDGVVSWLGCCYLGAINVPLNTAYRGGILEHALNLTTPSAIILEEQFAPNFERITEGANAIAIVSARGSTSEPATGERPKIGKTTLRLEEVDLLGDAADRLVRGRVHSWTDCPSLMFTSGTTGPSKAVVMQWLQLYCMAINTFKTDFGSDDDVFYIPWPLNHISGTGSIYATAIEGASAVLRDKWSTSQFLSDVYGYGCTFVLLMLEMTRYVTAMELPQDECPIRRFYAVPTKPDLTPLADRLGAWYITSYNSTEQSTLIVNVGKDPVPEGAAGKIRPGAECRVVKEDGTDARVGEVGELLTRTADPAAMFAGYYRMPEATATAMEGGWYHTGDAVRVDSEDYIYFLERMGDRLRRRGENVSAFEVEAALDKHPSVAASAVVGVPSHEYGEDEIVAAIVKTDSALTAESLADFAEQELPKFMRPSRYVFMPQLPQTPTGKIQRAEIRRLLNEEVI